MPALEHPKPGFLEQVFSVLAAGRQVEQITEETVLVLFDQAVEQVGIAAAQPAGQLLSLGWYLNRERVDGCSHSNHVYEREAEKTHANQRSGSGMMRFGRQVGNRFGSQEPSRGNLRLARGGTRIANSKEGRVRSRSGTLSLVR